jgi:Zn-dependent peptidase ImmA (M78 family)
MHPWRTLRERPDITVAFVDLPDGALGWCDHDSRTIYLATGMRQRQRRAVLVHELSHMDRGPVYDDDHLARREERAVESAAAASLIPLDALIEALLWSRDEHELAEELWTDVATVQDRLAHLSGAERGFIDAELDRREASL